MEITKGALAAEQAQAASDANALKLAEAQDALNYNAQLRQMQLQQQQDTMAANQQIRPLQIEQAKQQATLGTAGFENKAVDIAVVNALTVPQLPGESELDVYKKQLSIAMQMGGTAQAKALELVQQNGVRLRVSAAEKGDTKTAQDLLYEMNKYSPAFLGSLPPAQQMGVLTDKQLTYSIPKPADVSMLKHVTPSGDAILKGKLDAAKEASGMTEAHIQDAYLKYMAEQAKAGMVAMPYDQYRTAIVRTTGSAGNSVTSRGVVTPGVSPTGVPTK
jgi:hypothetical protein